MPVNVEDLQRALAQNEFRVYYQPIVTLRNGAIDKAEALIRWEHPERGLIFPDEFIPIAEDFGILGEIDTWVFKEAACQAEKWRSAFNSKLKISLNRSPDQFKFADGHQHMIDYLEEKKLTGESIVLEITERLLLDPTKSHGVLDQLQHFRAEGIQIALDDFGKGYCALSYLKWFRPNFLKIDRSLIENIATEEFDRILAGSVLNLAHRLGVSVIAEGVETDAQRNVLDECAFDYAQGYLYSKPVPVPAFEKLLIEGL